MRKSAAPSMRGSNPPSNKLTNTANQNPQRQIFTSKSAQIYNPAAKSSEATTSEIQNSNNINSTADKITYTIVWGKQSTKKHKTWEGDGTLVISGKSGICRDEENKLIGIINNIKIDELESGKRMLVGSKEIEIVEKFVPNIKLPIAERDENRPAIKRPKIIENKQFKPPSENPNNFFETSMVKNEAPMPESAQDLDGDEVKIEPLIMPTPSLDHQAKYNESKNPVSKVIVAPTLVRHLRPHQREGVTFLYECLMGFRMENPDCFGAILADEMGLGKTLQCISVFYTLLKQGPYGFRTVKRILIVTPSSLVNNWDKEISKWLACENIYTFVMDSSNNKPKMFLQSPHIPIMIVSYEMLVNNVEDINRVKFDLMICDEGHRLKNHNIKAAIQLNKIECSRRILLTGTPIQNDLQEFHSLIDFVNPGILGAYSEFKNKYETPILHSQQPNVLPQYRQLGEERAKELNRIISSFVLRRTQEVNNKYLPDKQELVIFCRPSELQESIISSILQRYEEHNSDISPLQLITMLKKICNHPALLGSSITEKISNGEKNDLFDFILNLLPPWDKMGLCDSGKLGIVESLLDNLQAQNEKIILVSYFTKTLDMLMKLCEHRNYKFCRLDGTTASSERNKIVASFNSKDSEIFVFLLSAKAGGAGLNLIGASRLLLFDNDWNPALDLQAMSRCWRDGQKNNVYIYRLLTASTIEEKIYQRQIAKTSLSGCVVDQHQNLSNLKFSNDELKELFTVPEAFDVCTTHEMLDCDCNGDGKVPEINAGRKHSYALKMQELMRWEHFSPPISDTILEELCLQNLSDEILYLFRNKTNSK